MLKKMWVYIYLSQNNSKFHLKKTTLNNNSNSFKHTSPLGWGKVYFLNVIEITQGVCLTTLLQENQRSTRYSIFCFFISLPRRWIPELLFLLNVLSIYNFVSNLELPVYERIVGFKICMGGIHVSLNFIIDIHI